VLFLFVSIKLGLGVVAIGIVMVFLSEKLVMKKADIVSNKLSRSVLPA
jgi:hypothetical protein